MKRLFFTLVFLLTGGSAVAQSSPPQEPGTVLLLPSEPHPGTEVRVAYAAPAWLEAGDAVVLRARLRTPGDEAYGRGTETRTIATLQREDDGIYRGRFVFPDSVVFALFAVSAPGGDAVDTNLRQGWPLLIHDDSGRPRAEALYQQLEDLTGRDFRGGVRVAQQLTAEYPDDPRSWNWLHFFEDNSTGAEADSSLVAERAARVHSFDRSLAEATEPDPDAVSGLIWLAGAMGTEVAERWTDWLIEHDPAHPTAVQFRVYRALRQQTSAADTLLAVLDRLYDETGPVHSSLVAYGFRTALASGDAGATLRWADRKSRTQPWSIPGVADALAALPATREEGIRRLREEIVRVAEAPDEERTLFATRSGHHITRRTEAARLQAALGKALLAAGDAAGALAPLEAAASEVWTPDLLQDVAAARLRAGDSLGAARALARVTVDPGAGDLDSVRVHGLRLVGSDTWLGLIAKAEEQLLAWTLRRAEPSRLPEGITVLDAEGEQRKLGEVLGAGPTVVVLYSRYCGYCVAATPRIEALRDRYGNDGARVVIVTAEPPGADSEAFFEEHGYRGPVVHDVDREAALGFGSAGVPAYFVLDGAGAVRFRFTSLDEIPRQVAALLVEEEELAR